MNKIHIFIGLVLALGFSDYVLATPTCTITCSTIGNITTCDQICIDPDQHRSNNNED